MEYTAHQKFIAKLQAPVKKYRKEEEKKRKKQQATEEHHEAKPLDLGSLEEEISFNLDTLFGPCDEE